MLTLCVTIENDINPVSVLVFLHLVYLRTPGQNCVVPVTNHLVNERFGTICQTGAFPMSGGARGGSQISTLTFPRGCMYNVKSVLARWRFCKYVT